MSSETRSTISGWLGSLGFGEDPTWAAAITRTAGAALGLYVLYWAPLVGPASEGLVPLWLVEVRRPHFGQYHDAVLLVAYLTFSYFSLSLVIKGIKQALAVFRHKKLLKQGEEWWGILRASELEKIQAFVDQRSQVAQLPIDSHVANLVKLGAIQPLSPGEISGSGTIRFRCNAGIWTFALSQDRSAQRRDMSDLAERIRAGLEAVEDLEEGIADLQLNIEVIRENLSPSANGGNRANAVLLTKHIEEYLLGVGHSVNPERFPVAAEKIKEGNKALEKFRKASNKLTPSPGESDKPVQG